jgi:hypothetical protein
MSVVAQKRAGYRDVLAVVKVRRGERANLRQLWQQRNGKNLWLMVIIRVEVEVVAEIVNEVKIVTIIAVQEIVDKKYKD